MEVVPSITRLNKIFKQNNWFDKDFDESAFNNFCHLLEVLEPLERELILELVDRYVWISGSEYLENIIDTLNLVPTAELTPLKKIYLFPIIKPGDEGKAKSGISLIYDLKGVTFRLENYKLKRFNVLSHFDDFKGDFDLKEDECLFLIDDYIGSGDTLNQCLDAILKNDKISIDKIKIITISCQKESYEQFMAKKVNIFTKHLVKKGISDYNEQPFIDEKKNLMKLIEKFIPGDKNFSLGWDQSEGIITLKRTPDNTFPIFWRKFKKNGKYFDAPFSRNENFFE